ncbi:MAG: divergent polysaccharide deacetylase family protein [Desulfobulbaceae bacterium]
MCWPGTNKKGAAPEAARWSRAAVFCGLALALVLLPVSSCRAFSAITVEDLRTLGSSPEIRVAQVRVPMRPAGKENFVFEEPWLFGPEGQPLPSGAEADGCAVPNDGKELPRVAIIIDDMGHHHRLGADLLGLELNLTFSFLPHAPFSRELAEQARQQGHDILVHMPMEPLDPAWDPGPGTLYLADPLEEIARKVAQNLSSVPHAVGINNHMGSRYTGDEAAMRQFFKLLSGQDLLFIDSGTSSASVAMETARAMGFKSARRHVFLDNVQSQEDICRQLKQLVTEARKRGWAIGIGHPNEATLTALTSCREMLQEQVRLVGIHELVR